MTRSTWLARLPGRLGALCFVGYLVVTHASDVAACGSYSETYEVTSAHPDLPLESFVGGRLGVLQQSYSRRYLIVAYRWLAGYGLTPREQTEVLRDFERRVRGSTRVVVTPEVDALTKWREVRARVPSEASMTPADGRDTVTNGGYDAASYDWVEWCLPDAFLTATAKLEAKLAARADSTAAWAMAQDLVFAQCSGRPNAVLPEPLPPSAPAELRRERDYQRASALFYARRYPEARDAFAALSRGAAPSDAALAKYLVARTQRRAGDLAGAEQTLRALLADPALSSRHEAATRYLGFIRVRSAPAAVRTELEQKLGAPGEVSELGNAIGDHSVLLDTAHQSQPLPVGVPQTDGERLRAWLALMQADTTPEAFARALPIWQAHPNAAWLLVALRHAQDPSDARVTPLLAAAAAIDRAQPAYASVHFERVRLLARVSGTAARRAAYAEAETLRASLIAADGISTYNHVRALTASLASSADAWLRIATTVPAGASDDGGPVLPSTQPPTPALAPDAAEALRDHVPLARWVRLVESSALPRELGAQLTATAYVRALLLGQRATATRLAPRVRTTTPALAPAIDAIERAADADSRALATTMMLLRHPHLAPSARAWGNQPLGPDAIDSSYGEYGWCTLGPAPSPPPAFLTRAELAAARTERAAVARLGSSPTYLAREATRLAARLPNDPRVPEALHLAVRLTRYGCRDADNTAASRGAFRALHGRFPNSEWTRRTRVHY